MSSPTRGCAESRDPRATRIDWPGTAAFSGALFLLVLALLRGNDQGWGSGPIVASLGGAAGPLAAFIAIELRVGQPMLPLALFRNPAFTGVQVAAFAVSCSMLAQFLYLTLYLQNHLGHPPLGTGCATCRSRWPRSSSRRPPACSCLSSPREW